MSSNGEFIRLETIGRRTGRPHTVLLRFIAVDNRVVVFPGKGSVQDWVQNIRTDPHVRVHAGGSVMEGTASLRSVTGLRDPILSIFTRKYGDKVVRGGYWGQTEYIQV
ncbi:MAG TPA: nitroreductase family deazaflavin-dependent oxidoreductase, partial [Nitrososphaerales archaeon]|nr:nitroreductase family deazaflavin-dependent oxidoreductase [Nitrososphaerales archaeon]